MIKLPKISKMKWMYFAILTMLLVVAIVVTIIYCDSPILGEGLKLFIKPKNADMLWYNLGVSYIVSYIFYFLVNFMPDWIEAKEKERELLNLKCAIHREIQLVTVRMIELWLDIHNEYLKKINSKDSLNDISELFNIEHIKQISSSVTLSIDLRDEAYANKNTKKIESIDRYKKKIILSIDDIRNRINSILTRYKNELLSKTFYDLFYILNESFMFVKLGDSIEKNILIGNGYITLAQCLNFGSEPGRKSIDRSCKLIIEFYNLVNKEYEDLTKTIKDSDVKIYNININKINRTKLL